MTERTEQFEAAERALKTWRNGMKYLGDPDPGASDPDEVYAEAHKITELLVSAGIAYDTLGVMSPEREEIIRQAIAHEDAEAAERTGWEEMDLSGDDY
jgi:hypothetical protein